MKENDDSKKNGMDWISLCRVTYRHRNRNKCEKWMNNKSMNIKVDDSAIVEEWKGIELMVLEWIDEWTEVN